MFDDSVARQDWGWEARIPLARLVEIMITNLRHRIKAKIFNTVSGYGLSNIIYCSGL